MIVYGDPQYEETLGSLLGQLGDLLAALSDETGNADRSLSETTGKGSGLGGTAALERLRAVGAPKPAQARHSGNLPAPSRLTRLDELRALLVHAGQLEQAVYDGLPAEALRGLGTRFHSFTDHAAAAFYACWTEVHGQAPLSPDDCANAPVGMSGDATAFSSRRDRTTIAQACTPGNSDKASGSPVGTAETGWGSGSVGAEIPAVPTGRGRGAPLLPSDKSLGYSRPSLRDYWSAEVWAKSLDLLACALSEIHAEAVTPLTVKIPEGFAFYVLYPEQYCLAALHWLHDHETARPRTAVVAGIRSIGTTLSAVVSAVLTAAGWEVRRLTVRLSGHPYSRQVTVAREELSDAAWALIVDEGPGQSGSSIAATAAALAAHGIDPARISFLPSHDGGPTGAAPEDSRAWWSRTRCYAVPLRELRWEGKPLPEALAARTVDLCPGSGPVEQVRDMAGGLWREVVYSDTAQWPAADGPFERTKYRCTMRDGTSIMWKFAGQVSVQAGPGSARRRDSSANPEME